MYDKLKHRRDPNKALEEESLRIKGDVRATKDEGDKAMFRQKFKTKRCKKKLIRSAEWRKSCRAEGIEGSVVPLCHKEMRCSATQQHWIRKNCYSNCVRSCQHC